MINKLQNSGFLIDVNWADLGKVSKGAKIRNRYNEVLHLNPIFTKYAIPHFVLNNEKRYRENKILLQGRRQRSGIDTIKYHT